MLLLTNLSFGSNASREVGSEIYDLEYVHSHAINFTNALASHIPDALYIICSLMQSHVSRSYLYLSELLNSQHPSTHYHVVFVPGNPGLVAYYHSFLTLLHEELKKFTTASYSVYAASLPNFSEDTGATQGLQQVITLVDNDIRTRSREWASKIGDQRIAGRLKVILIGHSVGAYIGLELVRRWQGRRDSESDGVDADIVGFVGLWPTITWISKSSNGKIASVRLPRMTRRFY